MKFHTRMHVSTRVHRRAVARCAACCVPVPRAQHADALCCMCQQLLASSLIYPANCATSTVLLQPLDGCLAGCSVERAACPSTGQQFVLKHCCLQGRTHWDVWVSHTHRYCIPGSTAIRTLLRVSDMRYDRIRECYLRSTTATCHWHHP